VLYRLESKQDSERVDLLVRLIQGKDETGAKLGREELTAEALIQLIAASDTLRYKDPWCCSKATRRAWFSFPKGYRYPDLQDSQGPRVPIERY
jgi:hypothetical protein